MSEHAALDRLKQEAGEVFERLKQERDELRLQSHLFKAELQDEWEAVETKFGHLEQRLERMTDDAIESVEDVGAAIKQVGEEIASAYRRLRNQPK